MLSEIQETNENIEFQAYDSFNLRQNRKSLEDSSCHAEDIR